MDNMKIWDQVKKTDPDYTKKVSQRGGYTAISPQYQIQEATKVFGPYGKGWGFLSIDFDYSQLETLGLCLVDAIFFYTEEDKHHEFPIKNAWPVKQGSRIDPDFAKKAETNTMSKALSKLGFSADVFMGQFDDADYVSTVSNEIAIEKAEDKIEAKAKAEEEYQAKVEKWINTLSNSVNMHDLQKCYKEFVRKANLFQDKVAIGRLERAKDKRKEELEAEG